MLIVKEQTSNKKKKLLSVWLQELLFLIWYVELKVSDNVTTVVEYLVEEPLEEFLKCMVRFFIYFIFQ